jgi:hypothetical protein
MWLLLFSPDRFVQVATEHAVDYERDRAPELCDASTGAFPAVRRADIEASIRRQVSTMRRRIYTGIGITAGTIVVGVGAGLGLRAAVAPVKWVVYALQGAGAAVILGATLAEVGRDIETWKRITLPEQVNAFTFRALYVFGTFLFVMSVAWDAG